MRLATFTTVVLVAGCTWPAVLIAAEAYPSRPVRMVVPYAPGGGTDTFARILARSLSERFGQPVLVDNRPGGGTIVGTRIVIESIPDGHTLLVNAAAVVINPLLHAKPPYDAQRDLSPIMQVAATHNVLAVHPGVPANTLRELIEHARARPGALNFASTGVGTPGHLSGELLASMAGIRITHVPYRGGAALLPDLLAGQVQMSFVSLTAALPHLKAGRIRVLGIASGQRSPSAPEIPTLAESGLPGYEASNWQGVFGPPKLPKRIIDRVHRELRWTLDQPDILKQFAANGLDPIGGTPADLAQVIAAESARWRKVIDASGARVD